VDCYTAVVTENVTLGREAYKMLFIETVKTWSSPPTEFVISERNVSNFSWFSWHLLRLMQCLYYKKIIFSCDWSCWSSWLSFSLIMKLLNIIRIFALSISYIRFLHHIPPTISSHYTGNQKL
jgi:hypothetical protein